ncbi:MAG: hypothetical protein VX893_00725 [Candidatus Latescibacterota bacterium]|nr:hypothetical protein [Candidatus Latescibacterota bacterium]
MGLAARQACRKAGNEVPGVVISAGRMTAPVGGLLGEGQSLQEQLVVGIGEAPRREQIVDSGQRNGKPGFAQSIGGPTRVVVHEWPAQIGLCDSPECRESRIAVRSSSSKMEEENLAEGVVQHLRPMIGAQGVAPFTRRIGRLYQAAQRGSGPDGSLGQ